MLHVVPSLGPARGGPSFAVPVVARGLAHAGLTVDVVTTNDNGKDRLTLPTGQPISHAGFRTWYFERQIHFYTFSVPLTSWVAKHINDYDLVHVHALFSYPSSVTAYYARRSGVPYVLVPHGSLNYWGMRNRRRTLKQASFRVIEQRMIAGASAIHFISESERDEAREAGVQGRAVVIPLGLELDRFKTLPSPDVFRRSYPQLADRRIILFMSRLDPKKGLDLLLPAFAEITRHVPEAVLVLSGSGDSAYVDRLKQEAARLGLLDQVLFSGFLEGTTKLSALSASEVFVLPSYSENFGIAAVEAMAAGVPVVLSDQVPVALHAASAHAALVIPCEVSALSAAMQRLLADSTLRRKLGEAGRRLAGQEFSSESTTSALLTLYRNVLETRTGQALA